jgi:hypothetical protein
MQPELVSAATDCQPFVSRQDLSAQNPQNVARPAHLRSWKRTTNFGALGWPA